jgi:hypothetical protein
MKLRNFLIVPACLLFALFSCQKDWLDVNTNPNSLPSSTPDYTFAAAANRIASNLGPNELGEYWSAITIQHLYHQPLYFWLSVLNSSFDYYSGYFDILKIWIMQTRCTKSNPSILGASKNIKSLYQMLVDIHGNVISDD